MSEKNPIAHNALADALAARGRTDDAAEHYEAALRLHPGWAPAYLGLADLQAHAGDVAGAIAAYERALTARPGDARARISLAFALIRADRDAEARRALERAAQSDLGPRTAELHAGLAQLEERAGRAEAAVRHYREALRIHPDLSAPANNLAWLLATSPDPSLRDPGAAAALAEALVRRSPRPEPELLDTLAAAYAAQGRFDAALRTVARAESLAAARGQDELRETLSAHRTLYASGRALGEAPGP